MNERPIGIFDSGIGGLTVLDEMLETAPNENYIYFGDTARIPYGEKTIDELVKFSREIINFFISKNVKMILMACNTSSATTLNIVKNEFDLPILGLITPTVNYSSELKINKIGLMATNATVKSKAYQAGFESKGIQTIAVACPGLVEIVENGLFNEKSSEEKVKEYLNPLLENNVEKIVFGCSHYPFLKDIMIKLGAKEEMFINPATCLAKETSKSLINLGLKNNSNLRGKMEFFVSSDVENFIKKSSLFLKGYEDACKNINLKSF